VYANHFPDACREAREEGGQQAIYVRDLGLSDVRGGDGTIAAVGEGRLLQGRCRPHVRRGGRSRMFHLEEIDLGVETSADELRLVGAVAGEDGAVGRPGLPPLSHLSTEGQAALVDGG